MGSCNLRVANICNRRNIPVHLTAGEDPVEYGVANYIFGDSPQEPSRVLIIDEEFDSCRHLTPAVRSTLTWGW